ncbi:MAG TPA: DUF1127 domain-containing protein [Crenalkalicoccus sp.]|jgi:uncharacterized protein YjiS (DUF1127 family)|nr:DUF1127 domain-containing protein [Crenalkalicoccus sp.]
MDARLTKNEIAFLLPLPRSAEADRIEQLRRAAREAHGRAVREGLHRALGRITGALGAWWERERAAAELTRLSDRELRDIGIARGEIRRVLAGG